LKLDKSAEIGGNLKQLIAPVIFISAILTIGLIVFSLGTLTNREVPQQIESYKVEENIPSISLLDNSEPPQEINALNFSTGKSLIVFISTECRLCHDQLKFIQESNLKQFKIFIISVGSDKTAMRELINRYQVDGELYFDKQGATFLNWKVSLPALLVIEDGKISYRFNGLTTKDLLNKLSEI